MIRTLFTILSLPVFAPFFLLGVLFAGMKFMFNVGYLWMNTEIIGRS